MPAQVIDRVDLAGGAGSILGLEFSGEVEAVGSEVRTVKPGDRANHRNA